MSNLEITNMVMVHDEAADRVVVIERVRSWCGIAFPGGHAEDGESIYDSAVREVYEETGLTVKNLIPCGFVYWFNEETHDRYFTYFYKTTEFTGTLIDGTEEGRIFWADRRTLSHMKLSPNMSDYLPMFDGKYSEAYCAWREGVRHNIIYR